MNNAQRKTLSDINVDINVLIAEVQTAAEQVEEDVTLDLVAFKANVLEPLALRLDDISLAIESEKDDEEGKYDNMPESLQNGEKGEAMQAAIEALDSAMTNVESAAEMLRTEDTDRDAIVTDLQDAADTELESAVGSIEEAMA